MTRIRYRKMPPLTGTAEAALHQTIELWKDDTAQKGKVATCPLCRILGAPAGGNRGETACA